MSSSVPGGSPPSFVTDTARLAAAREARTAQLLGDAAAVSFDTRLFARLVAAREVRGETALLGLNEADLHALYRRHFPHVESCAPVEPPAVPPVYADEALRFADAMRALLLDLAAPAVARADARCLAAIVAHACLRPDHLWRDLGLNGRDDVTAMLERYFPTLIARNREGLRWKKLLARELALHEGRTPGPAPGCPGCEDYGFCFGPDA